MPFLFHLCNYRGGQPASVCIAWLRQQPPGHSLVITKDYLTLTYPFRQQGIVFFFFLVLDANINDLSELNQ